MFKRNINNTRRKTILDSKLRELEHKKQEINESIKYIKWKHNFYDEILSGKRPYESNLINNSNK